MSLIGKFGASPARSDVNVACLSTDNVSEVMYIRDVPTVTGRWRVSKAQPIDPLMMPGVGVLISKTTPTAGIVRLTGDVEGIFSGLDVSKKYFVGDDGALVNPAPEPLPLSSVLVQRIGFPVASDILRLTGEQWMVMRKA